MSEKVIKRDNWIANFNLIGEAKINDYTFKIDERSEKSGWIYNSLNLGIDCGEKHGVVYCEMMGGFSDSGNNIIYAHGKDDNGNDDFNEKLQIDWEDRMNDNILESVGDLSFITVGLERTDKGKMFRKKFLSPYDAIAYIQEYLKDGMKVNVRGTLKYSTYNNKTQVRKNITSIFLSNADSPDKYVARFNQSILLDSDSASLKPENIDKDKSVMYIDARVLDYVKEINGHEIKGQYPFRKQFEYQMDFTKPDVCKKVMDKVFKVRKGITQYTFEGIFVEGGAMITATLDDIPDEIKELIEIGVYTEEEALARCSTNGNREQRMVLTKPYIRNTEDGSVLQRFDEKYTEEDLSFDFLYQDDSEDEDFANNDEDMDWLNDL